MLVRAGRNTHFYESAVLCNVLHATVTISSNRTPFSFCRLTIEPGYSPIRESFCKSLSSLIDSES